MVWKRFFSLTNFILTFPPNPFVLLLNGPLTSASTWQRWCLDDDDNDDEGALGAWEPIGLLGMAPFAPFSLVRIPFPRAST